MIGDTRQRIHFRPARSRARAALLAAAVACASCGTPLLAPELTPFDRYKVVVEETRARVYLGVPGDGERLSSGEREVLAAFARDYRNRGHGAVTIALPGEGVDGARVTAAALEARGVLSAQGVPLGAIDEQLYQPSGAGDVAMVVYYTVYEARAPQCHQDWRDVANTMEPNTHNFGCATQANLAAAIADPRDLVTPRTVEPSDLERRLTALGRYRKGDTTATTRGSDEAVSLSDAAN